MLLWIFGPAAEQQVELLRERSAGGTLRFANADVRWFLSVSPEDLPAAILKAGQRTYRSITLDGEEAEFSDGFTDLHTESYRRILAGQGFTLEDARPSIELVHRIRVGGCKGAGQSRGVAIALATKD
jgi:UDP-N-acetyl-2-amino-2-deoxyglucuronate dehydrogenase